MITAIDILEEVSNVFDLPYDLIISSLRSQREVEARQAAIYIIKTQMQAPSEEIRLLFGYKHRSSVSIAKRVAECKMFSDVDYRQKITKVTNSLALMRLKQAN